ncbi:putative extracellular otu-like cysteine [Phaeomoniella chlamydospora]|uniref:Putative extracellular otu-like cysteine n=1 Tax=Phaeomoniella chlamydospora TaxID=158046 RepID=A0A0G2DUM5_PHACM|nr:putative extracellular otu-like cysteine [Phaeomoniella chlamydospora]
MHIFTVPNLGRGHCLFASLADQVYGSHDRHPEMRQDIVQYIRKHPEDFFEWIDVQEELEIGTGKRSTRKKKIKDGEEPEEEDKDIQDHFTALNNRLERMEGREWGDEIEIAAFCQAFDYDVVLFTPTGLRVLTNPKHDLRLERRRIHIAYGGEERYPHYESIRKFEHSHQDTDSQSTESTSRESSQATEPSSTKSIEEINCGVVDKLTVPSSDPSHYSPKDVKVIDVFDLSQQVLSRRDIKSLLEDAASRANITLAELIKRDKERGRSSRSSSHDTASSGKRSRQADDDDDESPVRKIGGRRRSQRIKKKINIKLRLGPDPNAPPGRPPDGSLKISGSTPDHRSPLSQSQSTDDVAIDDQSRTAATSCTPHEAKSPITVDARA